MTPSIPNHGLGPRRAERPIGERRGSDRMTNDEAFKVLDEMHSIASDGVIKYGDHGGFVERRDALECVLTLCGFYEPPDKELQYEDFDERLDTEIDALKQLGGW